MSSWLAVAKNFFSFSGFKLVLICCFFPDPFYSWVGKWNWLLLAFLAELLVSPTYPFSFLVGGGFKLTPCFLTLVICAC